MPNKPVPNPVSTTEGPPGPPSPLFSDKWAVDTQQFSPLKVETEYFGSDSVNTVGPPPPVSPSPSVSASASSLDNDSFGYDYLQMILSARVYDVCIETPLTRMVAMSCLARSKAGKYNVQPVCI